MFNLKSQVKINNKFTSKGFDQPSNGHILFARKHSMFLYFLTQNAQEMKFN